jgi:hypothetical protein
MRALGPEVLALLDKETMAEHIVHQIQAVQTAEEVVEVPEKLVEML